MLLTDVNVLVYASRVDLPEHDEHRAWVQRMADGPEAFGLSELVMSAYLRVVTNPRTWRQPTSLEDGLSFLTALQKRPNAVPVRPGPRHWPIFTSLCRAVGARGNLVPDAYLAALAIESGSEWITADRGFARFAGLRWRHPLDG